MTHETAGSGLPTCQFSSPFNADRIPLTVHRSLCKILQNNTEFFHFCTKFSFYVTSLRFDVLAFVTRSPFPCPMSIPLQDPCPPRLTSLPFTSPLPPDQPSPQTSPLPLTSPLPRPALFPIHSSPMNSCSVFTLGQISDKYSWSWFR